MTSGYPFKYDFRSMKSGDTFLGIKFLFKDGNGDPLDFTDVVAKMQIRRTPGNTIIKEWNTTDSSIVITDNEVYVKDKLMNIPEYKYYYDLQITYIDGVVFTAIEGLLPISNDITR